MNFVPKNLLAPVPQGVTAAQAAYGTVGAIALHAVRRANASLGENVAVIGLGLVGLLAVQIAQAAGGRVLATDLDSEARAFAGRLGAECVVGPEESIDAVAESFTNGLGIDAILVCAATSSSDPVRLAASLCRDRGRVVVVGDVGLDIPRTAYYEKELELRLSRSYGPGRYDPSYEEHGHDYPIGYVRWTEQRNVAEFLRLVGQGLVDVDALTTHRFPVEQAGDAYALISGDRSPGLRPVGVVLEYAAEQPSAATVRFVAPRRAASGSVGIGLIGAGNFATRVLLPALSSDGRVRLVGVCTIGGSSAGQVGERFGFSYATSDAAALVDDPAVDAVVIATRHDSHSALAAQGPARGEGGPVREAAGDHMDRARGRGCRVPVGDEPARRRLQPPILRSSESSWMSSRQAFRERSCAVSTPVHSPTGTGRTIPPRAVAGSSASSVTSSTWRAMSLATARCGSRRSSSGRSTPRARPSRSSSTSSSRTAR